MNKSLWHKSLALVLLVPFAVSAQHSVKKDRDIARAVRAVLEAQSAAWNRGDIEGYMDGYWRSDQTIFVSGNDVTRGWQTVLERYKKHYDSPDKMGKLTFSEVEIQSLGRNTALVLGRWRLRRSNDEPHGTFTLIFKRTRQGWKIVHDHTSSAT